MPAGPSPLLLGVDLGTSAVKAGLFDLHGQPQAQAQAGYPVHRPHPGWAEQEPADWWAATCTAIRQALAGLQAGRLAAVGLCGQSPGLVLVDARGAALGRALTWQDRRASAEAAWLAGRLSPEQARAWTGLATLADPSLPPARLLWLQRHRPQDWRRTRAILQPKDYLVLRLTGETATDLHSAFGLASPDAGDYHRSLLDLLELDPARLPALREPTAVVGRVTPEAARETGLAPGTPVVTGTVDAWCSIIGCGAGAGQAADVAGTSEIVALVSDRPAGGEGIHCAPLIDRLYWAGGPTQAGGGILAWLAAGFCPEWGGESGLARLEAEAQTAPPGCAGLIFLPYLAGERAPLWDDRARGAWIGLTAGHTRAHCIRAAYEGVALAVRHILTLCERALGAEAGEVRVSGGGSRSRFWNQVKADVTGKRLLQVQTAATGSLGAAILAAMGAEVHPSHAAAVAAMVHVSASVEPRPELGARYDELFAVYRKLYPDLRPSLWRLGAIAAS